MSQRSRFCVLFSDIEDGRPPKTRLLHSDSSREDLINIWKQIYEDEEPVGAEFVINGSCIYKLDDDDDMAAFLAQAEDQYKILPSRPLCVKLVDAKKREMQSRMQAHATSDSPRSIASESKVAKQFTANVKSNNNNNNAQSHNACSPKKEVVNVPAAHPLQGLTERREPLAPWPTNPNAFMTLYSKYRQQSSTDAMRSAPTASSEREKNYHQTVATAIASIAGTSFMQTPSSRSSDVGAGYSESGEGHFSGGGPLRPYVKQFPDPKNRPGAPIAPNMARDKDRQTNTERAESFLPHPTYGLPSAYSAIISNIQEQTRSEQSNRQAYLLQTLLSHQALANAQRPEQDPSRQRPNLQFHDQSPIGDAFATASGSLVANGPRAFHPMQNVRSSALLSSLADYNNNNNNSFLAAYMNVPAFQALQNRANITDSPEDLSKKPKGKKRKRGEDGKSHDSTKRIRSSVDQSNIEFHYERALEYNAMDESEQKQQNSAHRSHWKHLLFVAGISPVYMRQYKHAKYDEWSSEARDIFAMCQPERYNWSFLTLSKQGDVLCARILARIDDLLKKKKEELPDWCPSEETLKKAQDRARERLEQLQRIMYSRSLNQEVKSASKERQRELGQERSAAFVEAYQQNQQMLMQQSQSLMHSAAPVQTLLPSMFAGTSGARCSSITSSPISMASPVLEEICASGSGRSDSSSPADHHSGGLAIQTVDPGGDTIAGCSRQTDRHSEPADDHASAQDFVSDAKNAISSTRKWTGAGMSQVAEHA